MVSTNQRTPVTEALKTLADLYEMTAEMYESQADGLDILLEQERASELDEPISPRPPNPDEYRIFAEDHRVQSHLFRRAAAKLERGEATPELYEAVQEFAEAVDQDDDEPQFDLRQSFM